MSKNVFLLIVSIFFTGCIISCKQAKENLMEQCIQVRASAYNSVNWQTTTNHANLTAWGDTLKPGMKVIAVSRDLIDSGLVHNQKVRIEGLVGEYVVKDKMHIKWKRKIDIYMGEYLNAARAFGVKKVALRWRPIKNDSLSLN